jgi:biopolymer transport protein TolQ
MNQDLSILHLVLNASVVVQAVMLLLMLVSISSWAAIFRKLFALNRVKAQNEAFERDFWSGSSLNDLFTAASRNAQSCGPMERIFASGMREFQKLRERRITDVGTLMDGARRAMRASFQREMDEVESNLSFLASVGSVSPYVGLFAAIPAVVAYNRFARDLDRIAIHQETFIEEFSNILQRNVSAQGTAPR